MAFLHPTFRVTFGLPILQCEGGSWHARQAHWRGRGGYIASPLGVGNSGTWTTSRPTPWMGLHAHLTWDGTLQDAASEHIL